MIIDANVARILARVANIEVSGNLRRNVELHKLAEKLVPEKDFKEFNWALLDLGATICTPKNPKHSKCPIASLCKFALLKGYNQKGDSKEMKI